MASNKNIEAIKFLYSVLAENVEYKKYNDQVLTNNSIKLVETAIEIALTNLVVDLALKN